MFFSDTLGCTKKNVDLIVFTGPLSWICDVWLNPRTRLRQIWMRLSFIWHHTSTRSHNETRALGSVWNYVNARRKKPTPYGFYRRARRRCFVVVLRVCCYAPSYGLFLFSFCFFYIKKHTFVMLQHITIVLCCTAVSLCFLNKVFCPQKRTD